MSVQDLALQRSKYKHLTDEEWRWFLQQVEGRERTADKLPAFAAIEGWWYPVRLSCEQCSSELTARYKAEIVNGKGSNGKCLDLTGGYGVDTYFLSEVFDHTDYVEQNPELCRIAKHNFSIIDHRSSLIVHNCSAEEFLKTAGQYDLIFLDPARRDSHGGKVFRLEDCTPNVVELLPELIAHLKPEGRLMLKLSPMLDLTQALKELSAFSLQWSVFVVAIKNEVKELLLLSPIKPAIANSQEPTITAIDLDKKDQAFIFTKEEEQNAKCENGKWVNGKWVNGKWENGKWLYEPNAAILKAGAYKLIAQRFGLHKLDVNTHLYTSDTLIPDFPGRVWNIKECLNGKINEKMVHGQMVNVLVRNYPLTPDRLKKKLHLRDGGTDYVIGCRIAGKPTLLWAERV